MSEHIGLHEKLTGFSPVYVINLPSRTDRLDHIKNQFIEYGINNYHVVPALDGETFDFEPIVFEKEKVPLSKNELGATISHLKTIDYWLKNSDSEYAIIVEDDLSFETVDKWNFKFNDFISSVNKPYDMLQLCIIQNHVINTNLHMREMMDWSAACYLIKRDRAKQLMQKYFIDEKYVLPQNRMAVADSVVYHGCKVLSIPLFTYNLDLPSSINFEFDRSAEETNKFSTHISSKKQTLDYWSKNDLPRLVL